MKKYKNGHTQETNNVDALAEQFHRQIKLDKSHYNIIDNERYFNQWKGATSSTSHSHKVEDVLNPKFRPITRAEQLLFQEKNGFMYDVFLTSIQTIMGIYFVRTHENTRDA